MLCLFAVLRSPLPRMYPWKGRYNVSSWIWVSIKYTIDRRKVRKSRREYILLSLCPLFRVFHPFDLSVVSQFFTVEIFQTFVLPLFAIPNDIDDPGSIIESYPDECIILRINFFMSSEIERHNYRKFDIEECVVYYNFRIWLALYARKSIRY